MEKFDVVVIGAGVAGLAAARALQRSGLHTVVLEARKRVGGRIHTIHDASSAEPAELGAEFVHGRPSELMRLAEEGKLAIEESRGGELCFEGGDLQECDDAEGSFAEILKGAPPDRDLTVDELLEKSQLSEAVRQSIRGFVEGFNAADATRASVQALARQQRAEDEEEGNRIGRVTGGYDAVPAILSSGLNVILNAVVDRIQWRPGQAEVYCGEQNWVAARVVITVPLGVLQSGSIQFEPQPGNALEAAGRLAMGHAIRLTLRFDERPWMKHREFATAGFVHAPEEAWPTWWLRGQLLTAWAGGPQAQKLAGLSREELVGLAMDTLAKILETDRDSLIAHVGAVHCHDWTSDPLALGAYSYVPVGAMEAMEQLARPVADTLFFAGEATDYEGQWGTVHGAIRSGERAAEAILRMYDRP